MIPNFGPRELTLEELIWTAWTMLKGKEDVDYAYFETDEYWWTLRLWISRN